MRNREARAAEPRTLEVTDPASDGTIWKIATSAKKDTFRGMLSGALKE